MRKILIAALAAIILSIITETAWFYYFSALQSQNLDRLISIGLDVNYLIAVLIWSVLYFLLFTLPFALLGHKYIKKSSK